MDHVSDEMFSQTHYNMGQKPTVLFLADNSECGVRGVRRPGSDVTDRCVRRLNLESDQYLYTSAMYDTPRPARNENSSHFRIDSKFRYVGSAACQPRLNPINELQRPVKG